MNHILTIGDITRQTLEDILASSDALHQRPTQTLAGKTVVFSFEKPSLRTVVATEVAIRHLGGHVIHVKPENFFQGKILFSSKHGSSHAGRESLRDTVKNISQWCDAIFARVFAHQTLLDIVKYSDIPVINALSDQHHPMQAVADLLTIRQVLGLEPVSVAFVGDANNVAFSLIEILLLCGYDVRFAGPEEYTFSQEHVAYFHQRASQHGGQIMITDDPVKAVRGAAIIYTDTFVSMGEEKLLEKKLPAFSRYQVNSSLLAQTGRKTNFMHCLPAHRGIEVTDDILDSDISLVYLQARNRMIVSKGVFTVLLNPEYDVQR